ncbi:unnamed protein product [Amoebophrya sp. A25]|nr:unnamed protein product [Amoebophrya sp. A25]|eukprot:GSA25T00015114001.1
MPAWSQVIEFLGSATKLEMELRGLKCFTMSSFSQFLNGNGTDVGEYFYNSGGAAGAKTANSSADAAGVAQGAAPNSRRASESLDGAESSAAAIKDDPTFATLFRVMELILQDFREKLFAASKTRILVLIQTVGAFARCVHLSVNVSFTAIKYLWEFVDILAQARGKEDPEARSPGEDCVDLNAEGDEAGEDWVWLQLFRQLQISCLDPRQEVRDCALKSLAGALCANSSATASGDDVSAGDLSSSVNSVATHKEQHVVEASSDTAPSKDDHSAAAPKERRSLTRSNSSSSGGGIDGATLTGGKVTAVKIPYKPRILRRLLDVMFGTCQRLCDIYLDCDSDMRVSGPAVTHHSANTKRKQWGETVALAMVSMRKVLVNFLPSSCTSNSAEGGKKRDPEEVRHWVGLSLQFVGLIWLCIKPPWGGGGFDITQEKESDGYFLGNEEDDDRIQAHAKTANSCLRNLGELMALPEAHLSSSDTETFEADCRLDSNGQTLWSAGWGLLWRLGKAFLTQPVLPEALADGTMACLQIVLPLLNIEKDTSFTSNSASQSCDALSSALPDRSASAEESLLTCYQIAWTVCVAMSSVPSLYVGSATPWYPISQSLLRRTPEVRDKAELRCMPPSPQEIEELFGGEVTWLWQPSIRGSLNLYKERQNNCDSQCIVEREDEARALFTPASRVEQKEQSSGSMAQVRASRGSSAESGARVASSVAAQKTASPSRISSTSARRKSLQTKPPFVPILEWTLPPGTGHQQHARNFAVYAHKRPLPHPLSGIFGILENTVLRGSSSRFSTSFVKLFCKSFLAGSILFADSHKPVLAVRVLFMLVGSVRQTLLRGLQEYEPPSPDSSAPSLSENIRTARMKHDLKNDCAAPGDASTRAAGGGREGDKGSVEGSSALLSDALNQLLPFVLLEVLKPILGFGFQRGNYMQEGRSEKEDIAFHYEAERFDVGLWKPAIEAGFYMVEDALHVVAAAASKCSRKRSRNVEAEDRGLMAMVQDEFWDGVIKFLVSINFTTTPLLDTAKICLIGYGVFGFLVELERDRSGGAGTPSPLLQKLLAFFDDQCENYGRTNYDESPAKAATNVLLDLAAASGESPSTSLATAGESSAEEQGGEADLYVGYQLRTCMECWARNRDDTFYARPASKKAPDLGFQGAFRSARSKTVVIDASLVTQCRAIFKQQIQRLLQGLERRPDDTSADGVGGGRDMAVAHLAHILRRLNHVSFPLTVVRNLMPELAQMIICDERLVRAPLSAVFQRLAAGEVAPSEFAPPS